MPEASQHAFTASEKTLAAQTATAISRRRHSRYLPQNMQAWIHTADTASNSLLDDAMVVDFSQQGAAVLVKQGSSLPAVGQALQMQLDYQGLVTRKIPVTVVHRRKFGAFAHLGLIFATNQQGHKEFEAIEISCIEHALFL